MYTGSQDITRTRIGEDEDLDEAALAGLLWVVTGVEDLTRAVLPREQLVLYADSGRVIPGVDEETGGARKTGGVDAVGGRPPTGGREAAGGRTQTGGRGAAGGRRQAGRGAAACTSLQAGRRDAASSGATASGDKGKHPRTFVPQPSSSSSPSPPRQRPSAGSTKE
ncbi:uncharacterized protein LOC133886441 [Phragmites australis]|uniref:uncharacterized protein LOC133886441 n=1 Tax=Phragmites australis TaxID=29695 RepID=UPI002D776CBD|nr:uncharacterized protein LOC133886441 [Phragmites australis]